MHRTEKKQKSNKTYNHFKDIFVCIFILFFFVVFGLSADLFFVRLIRKLVVKRLKCERLRNGAAIC